MPLRCTGELLINGVKIGGTFLLRQKLIGCRGVSTFLRFGEYLSQRREQASKSLLIQVSNDGGAEEVRDYLQSRYGRLESLYYYSCSKKSKSSGGSSAVNQVPGNQRDNHWVLAEFSSKQSALECVSNCQHAEGTLPFRSSMLLFQNGVEKSKRLTRKIGTYDEPVISKETLSDQNALPDFKKGKSLSEQLKILENSSKLSEVGIRVRFFVASQLEEGFSNLFPKGCVLPFGSTVSGIGRHSGDLDLVMVPDKREIFPECDSSSSSKPTAEKLLFQSKILTAANSSNARFQAQRVMETMADVIQLFIPGCTHVQRILQARVPILRFWSDFTDLQCDLSMTNS